MEHLIRHLHSKPTTQPLMQKAKKKKTTFQKKKKCYPFFFSFLNGIKRAHVGHATISQITTIKRNRCTPSHKTEPLPTTQREDAPIPRAKKKKKEKEKPAPNFTKAREKKKGNRSTESFNSHIFDLIEKKRIYMTSKQRESQHDDNTHTGSTPTATHQTKDLNKQIGK